MRVNVLVCVAWVGTVLCGSGREAQAREERELRTGPDDSYVVFGNGAQEAEAWLARGHGSPTRVPLPKSHWVLDALIDDTQQLWVALGPIPRSGPVQLWRFSGAQTENFAVAGTSSSAEVRLLSASGAVQLATWEGLWSLSGRSAAKLTSWHTDSYGFYGASLARSGKGFLLLVPTFNTCSSSDHLEALSMFELGATGRLERRAIPVPSGVLDRAWLGADGWSYAVGCDGDVGLIGLHGTGESWPILHREPAPDCRYHLQQNGRFTIVMLGKALVRLDQGRVERLGIADKGADQIEAFYPDQRGRALVLHADGAVVRYSSRQSPEAVGRIAALAK